MNRQTKTPWVRFCEKVIVMPETGCWMWQASTNSHGYGHFGVNGKIMAAHVFVYKRYFGEIPPGKELDHTCKTIRCVNPNHLEPVTHLENVRRGQSGQYQRAKTHCPKGHEYTEDNTYRSRKGRSCRRCTIDAAVARNRRLSIIRKEQSIV